MEDVCGTDLEGQFFTPTERTASTPCPKTSKPKPCFPPAVKIRAKPQTEQEKGFAVVEDVCVTDLEARLFTPAGRTAIQTLD